MGSVNWKVIGGAMAVLNNLVAFLSFFALLPIVSSNNVDLGSLLNQASGGNGGLDNLGDLLNQASGGNGGLNNVDLGDLLDQATGDTLKDLLKMAGLGENPQVLAIAEQFITDPNSLDEGQKVIVCEAMEVLMEDKPEVGNTLATLGMDTTTLCATSSPEDPSNKSSSVGIHFGLSLILLPVAFAQ